MLHWVLQLLPSTQGWNPFLPAASGTAVWFCATRASPAHSSWFCAPSLASAGTEGSATHLTPCCSETPQIPLHVSSLFYLAGALSHCSHPLALHHDPNTLHKGTPRADEVRERTRPGAVLASISRAELSSQRVGERCCLRAAGRVRQDLTYPVPTRLPADWRRAFRLRSSRSMISCEKGA